MHCEQIIVKIIFCKQIKMVAKFQPLVDDKRYTNKELVIRMYIVMKKIWGALFC